MSRLPVILLLLAAAAWAEGGTEGGNSSRQDVFDRDFSLVLRVAYFHDPRFPPLKQEDLVRATDCALACIRDKLQLPRVSMRPQKRQEIGPVFERVLGASFRPADAFDPFAPETLNREARPDQLGLLRRYGLDDLRAFLPESERAAVTDHAQFYARLARTWEERSRAFTGLRVDGKPAFTPDTWRLYQSASAWQEFGRRQRGNDIIVTNTVVFYDRLARPHPHAIFKHGKMGGSDLESPGAPNGTGYAVMVSTIGFSGIAPFTEADLPAAQVPEVLGLYLVAHETGHMVLRLPDVYDHPVSCLMCSPAGTLGYLEGYRAVTAASGPCPRCLPAIVAAKSTWLDTRRLGRLALRLKPPAPDWEAIQSNRVQFYVGSRPVTDLNRMFDLFAEAGARLSAEELDRVLAFILEASCDDSLPKPAAFDLLLVHGVLNGLLKEGSGAKATPSGNAGR